MQSRVKMWLNDWRLSPVCAVWVSFYSVPPSEASWRLQTSPHTGLGVFQELAGPLVWPGIHFHKEDLGILLRHRDPPYIPYFIFHSLWLWQCVPFFHQVCLFSFLLSLGENPHFFSLSLNPPWAALRPTSFIWSAQPDPLWTHSALLLRIYFLCVLLCWHS